jgi:hypothetical protein
MAANLRDRRPWFRQSTSQPDPWSRPSLDLAIAMAANLRDRRAFFLQSTLQAVAGGCHQRRVVVRPKPAPWWAPQASMSLERLLVLLPQTLQHQRIMTCRVVVRPMQAPWWAPQVPKSLERLPQTLRHQKMVMTRALPPLMSWPVFEEVPTAPALQGQVAHQSPSA